MIPERYQQKDSWPHQFMRTEEKKFGERGEATRYICQFCYLDWWNVYPRPVGACPARNDKSEYRRLGVENPNG